MARRILFVVLPLLLVLVAGRSVAYADQALTAQIPFKFVAAGAVHDPGRYELRVNADELTLTLQPAKGAGSPMPAITRLDAPDNATDARIVFDKVENTYYLSEAWFPGMDGFVLRATKEPHSHKSVKLDPKAKTQ